MSKAPASIVKDKFGEKSKLVEAIQAFTQDELWVNRLNTTKGLARVSNSKLLRLHDVLTEVKAKFGTRAKLIDAVCELSQRTKDAGYRTLLGTYPVPRLYDLHRSLSHSAKIAAAKAAKASK